MQKRRGETRQDTAARVRVSLADRLTVALDGALGAAARDELDPCPPADANAPVDIEVVHGGFPRCGDADEVAGDGGDGWLSSYRADGLHLARHAPGACVVTGRPGDLPLRVISDGELPGWALMRSVVRPLLQISLPARGAGTVHAAAVGRDGSGVLIVGWSESGKTELALALAERGWRLVADKWAVLGEDGSLAPFPVRAGIRQWVLGYLPHLRSTLPARTRRRMGAAASASRIAGRAAARAGSPVSGAVVDLGLLACAQGERLSLPLSELVALYDTPQPQPAHPPLRLVVVLRTVRGGPPRVRPLPAAEAARRMAESAAFERRESLGLLLRRRYAGADDDVADVLRRECEIIGGAMAQVPVIELSCPFPCDPRKIADVVEAAL